MHLIPEIMGQLQKGEHKIKVGNLSPKRDFIHVEDVCRAIITLSEQNLISEVEKPTLSKE